MRTAGLPARAASAAAAGATLTSTTRAARWLAQVWSPLLVLLAFRAVRRRNRAAAGALLLALGRRQVLDDVAYGAGVWAGCVRARTARPLLPWHPPDSKIN